MHVNTPLQKDRLHGQRGQTLPVWAFGILTVLTLIAFAFSYGNMLMWQIRAQNAADAAAHGLLSIQATQWNENIATLSAAAVEEYRIRNIMQALLMTIRGQGGCNSATGATGSTACSVMYQNLRQQYLNAVNRYTNDVLIINRTSALTYANQVSQIKASLALYQTNCGNNNGGDCSFDYTFIAAQPRVDQYLEDVYADCCAFVVGGGLPANAALSVNLQPMEIEIVTCANVPSLVPSFSKFTAPTFTAIGRAAATTIMSTQEFMYPGTMINPQTNQVFQPDEYPESSNNSPVLGSSTADLWYRVDYGGNPATSNGKAAFTYSPANDGLLLATGWWSAMPIKPFSGALTPGTNFNCK